MEHKLEAVLMNNCERTANDLGITPNGLIAFAVFNFCRKPTVEQQRIMRDALTHVIGICETGEKCQSDKK